MILNDRSCLDSYAELERPSKQRFLFTGGDPMARLLMFTLVLVLALSLPVLTGFSVLEALIILILATLSLNFLG